MRRNHWLIWFLTFAMTIQLAVPGMVPARGEEGLSVTETAEEQPGTAVLAAEPEAGEDLSPRFKDAALLGAVKEKLKLGESSPVTLADMKKLSSLDLRETPVTSLEGLQWATNLNVLRIDNSPGLGDDAVPILEVFPIREVDIHNTSITVMPRFRQSRNFSYLDMSDNKLRDVSALSGMKLLSSLQLDNNELDNDSLADIVSMVGGQLNDLHVANCRITDLSALQTGAGTPAMPGLTSLDLNGNRGTDGSRMSGASALTGYSRLKVLRLNGCSLSPADYSVLGTLPLTELDVGNCGISDFNFLFDLIEKLTHLTVSGNNEPDSNLADALDIMSARSSLTTLNMDRVGITDLSCLPKLTNLSARDNGITSLEGIQTVTGRLYLSDNDITDLTPLREWGSIAELDVSGNGLMSLAGLPNKVPRVIANSNKITALRNDLEGVGVTYLSLEGNGLVSLAGVPNTVVSLRVSDNELLSLKELGAIEGLALGRLEADRNQLVDLDGIQLLPVKVLSARDNQLTDISPLKELEQLQTAVLDGNFLDDSAGSRCEADVEELRANGVAVSWEDQKALPSEELPEPPRVPGRPARPDRGGRDRLSHAAEHQIGHPGQPGDRAGHLPE